MVLLDPHGWHTWEDYYNSFESLVFTPWPKMGRAATSIELESTDVNDNSDTSSTKIIGSNKKNNGIFLSWPWFITCILAAVALSTLVGLIVHFAHPEKSCVCPTTEAPTLPATTPSTPATTTPQPTTEDYVWEFCINVSLARNECFPCQLPTAPPVTTTPAPSVNYRLPTSLVPSHYDIELRPDIYGSDPETFSFTGSVSMDLECASATNVIIVHKRKIEVDMTSIVVRDVGNDDVIQVLDTTFDPVTEFYTILLARTLIPGEQIVASMNFEGPLELDMAGMYWSDYMLEGERKFMMATQFESTDARKAFPCLDEPQLKATFNVTLEHQPHMTALNNMPNYTYEVLEDGWVRSRFEKTNVLMPTYLVAMAIAEFDSIENVANGPYAKSAKPIQYWAQPDFVEGGYADWAARISPGMFDFFEDYFDLAFDLPKTDQICVPDFAAGAMENWGLITYTEQRMIYKPLYTTLYTRQRMTGTIGHELLHMDAVFFSQVYYRALDSDSTGSSHPLTNPAVFSPEDSDSMFSSVTYDKGGCVIRMARDFMGKENFDNGMRHYVDKMKYQNAIEDDLYASWEENAPMEPSVGERLRPWSNQMGYPLVTIKRSADGSQIEVTQKMYLQDPEAPIVDDKFPTIYGYKWDVPISYTTSKDSEVFNEWLFRDDRNITLNTVLEDNDWILANLGQTGFYRVNYDEKTWQALIQQLQDDHEAFEILNRAQLVQDSLKFARSGDLDQVTALNVINYLSKEEGYIPFYAMTMASEYLDGMLNRYSPYGKYREFVTSLVQPNYVNLGWTIDPDDPLTETYLRTLVIETACQYGHVDCQTEALALFDTWTQDSTNMSIIAPDLRPAVYCTAVREKGEETFEWILQRYEDENDENESPVLRDALSCTRDPSLLNRLFLMAVDGDIKPEDRVSVMLAVARNVNGKHVAWENINTMWDTLPSRNSVLSAVSEYYSTPEEYEQLLQFTQARVNDFQGAEEDILRTVRANMRWVENNAQDVMDWLENLTIP